MSVSSSPKRRGCDLNPGPSAPFCTRLLEIRKICSSVVPRRRPGVADVSGGGEEPGASGGALAGWSGPRPAPTFTGHLPA